MVAAVRDPARMEKVALENGISRNDYVAMKLELASLQSVKVRRLGLGFPPSPPPYRFSETSVKKFGLTFW